MERVVKLEGAQPAQRGRIEKAPRTRENKSQRSYGKGVKNSPGGCVVFNGRPAQRRPDPNTPEGNGTAESMGQWVQRVAHESSSVWPLVLAVPQGENANGPERREPLIVPALP